MAMSDRLRARGFVAALTLLLLGLITGGALASNGTVRLGYVLWDSEIASTNVVAAVLEDKLGYDVEMIAVDAGPMWTGIAQGDFDAIVAAWLPATHEAYYNRVWQDVENLGPNLHGAKIGLVVPAYVTIDSIEELNAHRSRFQGRIVGIDPGAGLMRATDAAIDAYGLDFTLQDGSDAAMTAELGRAIRSGQWIVVTGWTPHWKFAQWELKYLEDPKGVFGASETINTIVAKDLRERMPEVYEFLDRFYWTPDDMATVMVYIREGMSEAEAARRWIAENPEKVEAWLP